MRIISRKVKTSHTKEEVFRLIKNAASRYYPVTITDDWFQFKFQARWYGKNGFLPVKGSVRSVDGGTEVWLQIHGEISFYIGMLLVAAGLLITLYKLLTVRPVDQSVFFAAPCLLFGIFLYGFYLFSGIMCLDALEHRLTRQEAGSNADTEP